MKIQSLFVSLVTYTLIIPKTKESFSYLLYISRHIQLVVSCVEILYNYLHLDFLICIYITGFITVAKIDTFY